jgi:hypothetical protein
MLRPGNAGANTAADHKTVLDLALAQIPVEYIESLDILVRADRAGATHELADYCRDARMRFSFGYDRPTPSAKRSSKPQRMLGSRRSTRTGRRARTAR